MIFDLCCSLRAPKIHVISFSKISAQNQMPPIRLLRILRYLSCLRRFSTCQWNRLLSSVFRCERTKNIMSLSPFTWLSLADMKWHDMTDWGGLAWMDLEWLGRTRTVQTHDHWKFVGDCTCSFIYASLSYTLNFFIPL